MRIAIFVSGHPRTLFYKFSENLKVIRESVGECQIDVFYSLWDDTSRYLKINGPYDHFLVEENFERELTVDSINQYFIECGANYADGEIESTNLMEDVISKSPFKMQKSLSSQYYKIYKVAQKYFESNYDFYVRIRPDIVISNFLSREQIINLKCKKSLIINEYYWYNATYDGNNINEMIWGSSEDIFLEVNNLFSHQEEICKQCYDKQYGEFLTGRYFNNLLSSRIISSIDTFNFNYKVFR